MQKIKNSVLENWIDKGLNKMEVLFLLTIAKYQDSTGTADGMYYKDICTEMTRLVEKEEGKQVSYTTFYDVIESLVQKGIITAEVGVNDRKITIIGNDFSDKNYKKGYISLRYLIFSKSSFASLKANEMLMLMDNMKNIASAMAAGRKPSICIGVRKFYEKYAAMFHVSERVIQGYLTNLRKFLTFDIQSKNYTIKPLEGTMSKFGKVMESVTYRKNLTDTVFRRLRMKFTDQTRQETSQLIIQYWNQLKDNMTEVFSNCIRKSLELANVNEKNPYKWDRNLNPKLVHKLLKEAMLGIT